MPISPDVLSFLNANKQRPQQSRRAAATERTVQISSPAPEKITAPIITQIPPVQRNTNNLIPTAGYARISTGSDLQETSLESQIIHLEQVIKADPNAHFVRVYTDEAISGTSASNRPGLQELIADCRSGKVQRVICKSISRMARNVADLLEILRLFKDVGASVLFEKESIDTATSNSEFLVSILGAFSAEESLNNSLQTKIGHATRFARGDHKVFQTPYGYEKNSITGDIVIIPSEAEIVKEIFTRFLAGEGSVKIANDFEKRRVPTKHGGRWFQRTVLTIAQNIFYTGAVLFQKYYNENYHSHKNRGEMDKFLIPNHHEAIIDQSTFDAVQSVIAARRVLSNSYTLDEDEDNANYRLGRSCFSGRLFCACCGAKLNRHVQGNSGKDCGGNNGNDTNAYGADPVTGKILIWKCSAHVRDKDSCPFTAVKQVDVENAFVNLVNKIRYSETTDLPILTIYIEGLLGEEAERNAEVLAALSGELQKIEYERQSVTDLAHRSAIAPANYKARMNELVTREAEVRRELNKLQKSYAVCEAEKFKAMLPTLPLTAFDEVLFAAVVEAVEVKSGEKITFDLKCGLSLTERFGGTPSTSDEV